MLPREEKWMIELQESSDFLLDSHLSSYPSFLENGTNLKRDGSWKYFERNLLLGPCWKKKNKHVLNL